MSNAGAPAATPEAAGAPAVNGGRGIAPVADLPDDELRDEIGPRRRLRLVDETDAPPRSECIDGPRPCERACRYRLDAGACALDLAALGGMTLDEVGGHFGLTRERVRQIEKQALAKLRASLARLKIDV